MCQKSRKNSVRGEIHDWNWNKIKVKNKNRQVERFVTNG